MVSNNILQLAERKTTPAAVRSRAIATRHNDQAASLRQLLGSGGRSIALVGGKESGVTTLTINLAAALAAQERRVLLLDEDDGYYAALRRLQLRQRYGIAHALHQQCRLEETLLTGPGFELMPAALPRQIDTLSDTQIATLGDAYDSLIARIDCVLVDSRPIAADTTPGLALSADEVLIVAGVSNELLMSAYVTIKRLHLAFGCQVFRVLINQAATLSHAKAIFGKLRQVARQYLTPITMQMMGFIPKDEALIRADHLGQAVVQAFPHSAAAQAFTQLASALPGWPLSRLCSGDQHNLLHRALHLLHPRRERHSEMRERA